MLRCPERRQKIPISKQRRYLMTHESYESQLHRWDACFPWCFTEYPSRLSRCPPSLPCCRSRTPLDEARRHGACRPRCRENTQNAALSSGLWLGFPVILVFSGSRFTRSLPRTTTITVHTQEGIFWARDLRLRADANPLSRVEPLRSRLRTMQHTWTVVVAA